MNEETTHEGSTPEAMSALPARLIAVFSSPGRLTRQLVTEPRWVGALLVCGIVAGVTFALIPVELLFESQRQAALARGAEFPELPEQVSTVMRVVIPSMTVVSTMLFTALMAGLYTIIFAFILGDEGRYVQYLAVVSHAWFIAISIGLLITPLRIATGDPQYTLNLASFAFFLPDGYWVGVLRALDLTQIWSTLVIAQGVHAIDSRRSFKSAATILLSILFCLALILGRFL